jgi:hypothetical protein
VYRNEEKPKQLNQDEIIEILDQFKASEWPEKMVNANIDNFEMSCEESVSYFKTLENLEMIRQTNGPGLATVPIDNTKSIFVFVTSNIGKSFKNPKASNMCCYHCDKNNHNKADCRPIFKFKHQKMDHFDFRYLPVKKSLAILFKDMNALKRQLQLKPEKIARSMNAPRKAESTLCTEIDLITSSHEGDQKEYFLTSSKHFSSSKTNLEKSSHITTNH